MITVDASIHVNALNPSETASAESKAFLEWLKQSGLPVVVPTLLLVEVAAAVARGHDDEASGIQAMQRLRNLPEHTWVPLSHSLAAQSARLAAQYHLRGADAVYAAVAQRAGATLVTTDRQQLERLDGAVSVMSPGQALSRSADPRVAADLAMRALRGRGRGERPVERLLEERQKDRDREA